MYPRPRKYPGQQSKVSDYLMPFLIILCVGVVLVLGFNLWKSFYSNKQVQAAYLHIAQGSAQMKAWGTADFFNLTNDSVIMQGDELRSSADAQLIVEFFDGTIMRMSGGGDVSFEAVDRESKTPKIDLKLTEGKLWFNMLHKNVGQTNIVVNMENLVVYSNAASIFAVENGQEPAVRVFDVFDNEGVRVDVLSEDKGKTVETENIGIGQQIIFTDGALKKYWAHQSPTVLAAIDDNFKKTDWYGWNLKEDQNPIKFEKNPGPGNEGLVKVDPELVKNKVEPADTVQPDQQDAKVVSGKKPTFISLTGSTGVDAEGRHKVSGKLATIKGGADGAAKIMVNDFTLQKFKAGDKNWTYYANADYGFMKPGENIYQVYAFDDKGNKSEPLVIKVVYTPASVAASGSVVSGSAVSGGLVSGAAESGVPTD